MGTVIPFRPRCSADPITVVAYQPELDLDDDLGWLLAETEHVRPTAIVSTEAGLWMAVEQDRPDLVLVVQDFALMRQVSMQLPPGVAMAYAMRDAEGVRTWRQSSGGLRAIVAYPLRQREIDMVVAAMRGRRGATWATR